MHFYDENGDAQLYTDDGVHLFTWDGEPVAYFEGDNLYDYDGTHRGWFRNGWICDQNGDCMLFEPDARGGPIKPLRSLDGLKSLKSLQPLKGLRELAPLKPLPSSNWSRTGFWWQ